ncbi:flavin reductase family protein [Microbacterium sp.]|uniref:flavin reductase family protein n=1 Tax=Microbacterium sp. TaxID=51671 RepID=UPI0039E70D4E
MKPEDNQQRGLAAARSPIVSDQMREAIARLPTGVTVVTTVDEGRSLTGATLSSFTQVSLESPSVLICVNRDSRTCDAVDRSGIFAVNVLAASQERVARAFSMPGESQDEKFASVHWSARKTGAPVFDGVCSWMDCVTLDRHDFGTHAVFIGAVVAAGSDTWDEAPLTYYRHRIFPLRERA